MSDDKEDVKRVVLDGGPCGGKTTGKEYVREKLLNFDRPAIFVPEVATLIIGCGLNPGELTPEQYYEFQRLIFSTQLKFENDIFRKALQIKAAKKPLIIMDRGLVSGKAYMTLEMFERVLADHGMDEVEARDERYDGVFHLSSIADGKPELYAELMKNNPSRLEKTPEDALAADNRTRDCWLGHPHLRVIDNSTDFEQKMNRLLNEIRRLIGDPVAIETERWFLVRGGVQLRNIPVASKKINIEQVYLTGKNGIESRIRRRSQEDSGSVYYETQKLPATSIASRPENEWQISPAEYAQKLRFANSEHDIIRKTRVCFLYKNQYFELDIIREPKRLLGMVKLEIELTEDNAKVEIPDFLGKVEEVTGDPKYSNYALSRRPKS